MPPRGPWPSPGLVLLTVAADQLVLGCSPRTPGRSFRRGGAGSRDLLPDRPVSRDGSKPGLPDEPPGPEGGDTNAAEQKRR